MILSFWWLVHSEIFQRVILGFRCVKSPSKVRDVLHYSLFCSARKINLSSSLFLLLTLYLPARPAAAVLGGPYYPSQAAANAACQQETNGYSCFDEGPAYGRPRVYGATPSDWGYFEYTQHTYRGYSTQQAATEACLAAQQNVLPGHGCQDTGNALGGYSTTVGAAAYIECFDSRCAGGGVVHFFEYPFPNFPGAGVECSVPGGKTQPVQNGGTSGASSPSDFHCGSEKNDGPPAQCGIGNPCNPATGNKYQVEEDYRGSDGTLFFVRSYNSFLDANTGMGKGWIATFHKRLEILNNSSLKIRQGTGRGELFIKNTLGFWQGDPDSALTLTQDTSGYTLTHRDKSSERYDIVGKLISETDSSGRITNYSYDINERPVRITDAFGRTLIFGYNTNNYVATITDSAGKVISYSYDTNNNLTRVDYPDNTAKLYHYNEPSFTSGANLPHSLTGISYATVNPDGSLSNITRYATYGYDTTGKALSTEHAVTTNGSPQEKFTLAYNTDTQTTVTDPVGMNEVLTFNTN